MTVTETAAAAAAAAAVDRPARRLLLSRTGPACLLLLLLYLALSFANDPRGYLGDTGSKVATLRAMDAAGGFDLDVGYWAAAWDPDGDLHPLFDTRLRGDKWVAVTTLPAIYVAAPLFRVAGYRGALLVPMAGAVLAALAARALARRLGGTDANGWAAFWLVGLASPLTLYALDFWEHSLGVGLMGWGMVLLYDLAAGDKRRWTLAAGAGLLFGTAATMRTEALVYGLAATAVTLATMLWRHWVAVPATIVRTGVAGLAMLAGLALPLAANGALERAVIGADVRTARAATTVTAGGVRDIATRADEAALTSLALEPGGGPMYVQGALLLLLLVAVAGARNSSLARFAAAGAGALYLLRFAGGLGFVPGLVAATPLAAAGLMWVWRDGPARLLVAFALVPLPLVWATQYTGGMRAQWAGRYVLPTGLLLMVVGVAGLPRMRRSAATVLVALAVAVTAFGVGWLSLRSHDVARSGAALARRPEPVVVSRLTFLMREFGWYAGDRRWLTAGNDAEVRAAGEIVAAAGFDRFALVDLDGDPTVVVAGFRPAGVDHIEFVAGVPLRVTTYVKPP